MRMYPREFPSGRRKRPKRRAEKRVYEALAGSALRGFVYYEWRRGYEYNEVDFILWVEGLGRFALQVKGGVYFLDEGEWFLITRDGVKSIKNSPLDETWLAMLDLHDDILEKARTSYDPFVLPVLIFPDMEPDEAIEKLASRKGVYLVWGAENLLQNLEKIVRSRGVSEALPLERIKREVCAATDGLVCLEEAESEQGSREGGLLDPEHDEERLPTLSLSVHGLKVIAVRARSIRFLVRTTVDGTTRRAGDDGCRS